MHDTHRTNEPGCLGAIASMQLEAAKLVHSAPTVDALRDEIRARAEALGLVVVDVSLTQDSEDLTATATFDICDDGGTAWATSFTRGVH